jgi:hypothetical protein
MKNGLLKLDWENVKSAVVYGLLTMFVVFVISISEAVIAHGSIFGVDWKNVVDISSLKVLGVFISGISIVKNLLTTNDGKFFGLFTVVSDKTE